MGGLRAAHGPLFFSYQREGKTPLDSEEWQSRLDYLRIRALEARKDPDRIRDLVLAELLTSANHEHPSSWTVIAGQRTAASYDAATTARFNLSLLFALAASAADTRYVEPVTDPDDFRKIDTEFSRMLDESVALRFG